MLSIAVGKALLVLEGNVITFIQSKELKKTMEFCLTLAGSQKNADDLIKCCQKPKALAGRKLKKPGGDYYLELALLTNLANECADAVIYDTYHDTIREEKIYFMREEILVWQKGVA